MKRTLALLFLSSVFALSATSQSIKDQLKFSEPVNSYTKYQGAFTYKNQVYMYRNPVNQPMELCKADENLNVTESNQLSLVKVNLSHRDFIKRLGDKHFIIYNGYVSLNKEQTLIQEVDLNTLKLVGQKKVLTTESFKLVKTSPSNNYIVFASEKDIKLYDAELNLVWKHSLVRYKTTMYLKDLEVDDNGEAFLLIGKVNNTKSSEFGWHFTYHVLKASKSGLKQGEDLNPGVDPYLRDVVFETAKDGGLRIMAFTMSSESDGIAGIYVASINKQDVATEYDELLDVSEFMPQTSKIHSITHFEPFYMDDGSCYLVGQLHWASGEYNTYSTVYVAMITPDNEVSWVNYFKRHHYSGSAGFRWAGAVPMLKDGRLHVLYNDIEANENVGDEPPKKVEFKTGKKQLYEREFDVDGTMSLHKISYPSKWKKVYINCEVYSLNNVGDGLDVITLQAAKGGYKKVYTRW